MKSGLSFHQLNETVAKFLSVYSNHQGQLTIHCLRGLLEVMNGAKNFMAGDPRVLLVLFFISRDEPHLIVGMPTVSKCPNNKWAIY
jgi:hypothetical protein